jgi:hypothetical protein
VGLIASWSAVTWKNDMLKNVAKKVAGRNAMVTNEMRRMIVVSVLASAAI